MRNVNTWAHQRDDGIWIAAVLGEDDDGCKTVLAVAKNEDRMTALREAIEAYQIGKGI